MTFILIAYSTFWRGVFKVIVFTFSIKCVLQWISFTVAPLFLSLACSVSVSLNLPLCLSLPSSSCLTLPLSVVPSFSLSVCLSGSLFLYLSVRHCLYFSFCLSVTISLSEKIFPPQDEKDEFSGWQITETNKIWKKNEREKDRKTKKQIETYRLVWFDLQKMFTFNQCNFAILQF